MTSSATIVSRMPDFRIPLLPDRIARRFTWSRIRGAFEGTIFLTLFVSMLCFTILLGADGPDYQDVDTPAKLAQFLIALGPTLLLTLLVPVPLVALGFNLAPRRGWRRLLVVAGVLLGYAGYDMLFSWPEFDFTYLLAVIAPVVLVYEFRQRARLSAAELVRRQIDTADLNARVAQSRMHLLRAQIEPHFLFNTLANVRRLAKEDPSRAAEALGDLMHYLEAALPHTRAELNTLADEASLIDAYLKLYQLRMGTRLSYEIQIPSQLSAGLVPSMMLLTLIENAIKHGINPLTQGGHIVVRATRENQALQIAVADSGRGVSNDIESGTGTGLSNIRARLQLQYGRAARLLLERGTARGFTATIMLPWTQR